MLKKSILLKIVVTVAVSVIIFLLWFGIVVISTPELTDLNQCYFAKMNQIKICPKSSRYAQLGKISENLINAIVVSEDAGFWSHNGLDWHELKASFKANLRSGRFKRGGSTITQQLIKNVYFSGEKTLTRKVKEALLAIKIEKKYSKKIILEKYLNTVEWGPNIYGIVEASNHYFAKSPSQLSILESSFLAFLLPNPKGYYKNFKTRELSEFARKMTLLISKRLYFYKKISRQQYNQAKINIDRFPWHDVVDNTDQQDGDSGVDSLSEQSLEDEFERILLEDIPQSSGPKGKGAVNTDEDTDENTDEGADTE